MPSQSVQPILSVTAVSTGPNKEVLSQRGPLRSFDLSAPVEDIVRELAARDTHDFSIDCLVDLVDAPELRLPAATIADLASRKAAIQVILRNSPSVERHAKAPETLPEVEALFSVSGLGFDPAALTDRSGLVPDSARRAGELGVSKLGVRHPKVDIWSVRGGPRREIDFGPSLHAILARVVPKSGVIRAFAEEHRLEATLELVALFVELPPRLTIGREHFVALANLGAGLWCDLYKREEID